MVKIIGVGRLTRDPEVSYNKKGNGDQLAVARFTLAVKRPYVKEGQQDTDFLPCVVFGKPAETAEKHLSKGAKVAFEGRPQSSTYKDKDGKDQFSISFLIENWEFDESKAEAEARKKNSQQGNGNPQGNQYQQGNGNPQGNQYHHGNPNTKSYEDLLPPNAQYNEEQLKNTLKRRKDSFRRFRDLSIFAFIGVYLISIIDAYVDAELSNFDITPDLSMKVEPAVIDNNNQFRSNSFKNKSVGLQCVLRF